jgi:hypothetical protein
VSALILNLLFIELPPDGAVLMMQNDRPVGNPKRRFDEYSSKFSLSYETKVINLVGKSQTQEVDAC